MYSRILLIYSIKLVPCYEPGILYHCYIQHDNPNISVYTYILLKVMTLLLVEEQGSV